MSVSIKYKGAEIASASTEVTKTIKTAGKYCEADILVENTPDGGDAPVINPLSVTANGTYTAPSGVDGYSPVTVNVPQGITPSGSLDITENGTYDVTEYAEAVVDVSGGTTITDGIVVKARDASGNITEVDYYGDTVYPWTFGAGNENGSNSTNFVLRHLQKINFKNTVTKLKNYAIAGCMELSEVSGLDFNALTEAGTAPFKFSSNLHFDVILNTSLSISFYGCGITSIVANEWSQLPNNGFYNCTSLVSAKFSKATIAGVYTASQFRGCTALQTAELGSVGYGVVTFPGDSMFVGCTQVGLTIVFYTDGSHADTALAKSRSGATNATIIIKASEATTYNGTAYAAGDTMITSNP